MSYLGGATLDWQSDYAQFYLVDGHSLLGEAPVDITPEMMQRRWHPMPSGLVVYTNDCLRQLIEVRLFSTAQSADATDYRSDQPWTQTEIATAMLPSRTFSISSPSKAGTEAYGPHFRVDGTPVIVRIQWMELGDRNYDREGPQDVIRLDIWPG